MKKIKISEMTGKLKDVPAINTNTLGNPFCQKMHENRHPNSICRQCYSFRMMRSYRANCTPAWEHNSKVLLHSVLTDDELPIFDAPIVRFHGHGELLNMTHYYNFCRIAKKNPATNFALWTKRRDLIRRAHNSVNPDAIRPENLILVYSNPYTDRVMIRPPRHFDKVFNNTTELTEDDNCSGRNCFTCRQCYSKDSGVDVIVEQVK